MKPGQAPAEHPPFLRNLGRTATFVSFRLLGAVMVLFAVGGMFPRGSVMNQIYQGISLAFIVVADCLAAVFSGSLWPLGLHSLSVFDAALYVSLAVAAYILYTAVLSALSAVLTLAYLAFTALRARPRSA